MSEILKLALDAGLSVNFHREAGVVGPKYYLSVFQGEQRLHYAFEDTFEDLVGRALTDAVASVLNRGVQSMAEDAARKALTA